MRLEDVHPDSRTLVQEILDQDEVKCVQVSCHSEEGVMELKNKACDTLLAHRVDNKIKGTKVNSIINRIHVAQPKPRDDVARPPFIPDAVKDKKKYDKNELEPRRLLKDQELKEGGPGVFNINLRGMGISIMSLSFESPDQLCRKLHSCQSRVEDGRHPRDHGRQEHRRLC